MWIPRHAFECANLVDSMKRIFWASASQTRAANGGDRTCTFECVRKQKQWSWTLLIRRIHSMIHGNLEIHICIRKSVEIKYDLNSLWIVLPNVESPSNSQRCAYEIFMTTDKERVIYVTFIPVPRIIYVLNNLVKLFIINGILFAFEAFQTVYIWAYWSLHVDELLSPMFVDFKFITLKIQVRDYLNPLNLMKQLCSMKLKKLFGRTFSQNATTLIACLIQFMLWPAEQAHAILASECSVFS